MRIGKILFFGFAIAASAMAQKEPESKLLSAGTPAPSFSLPALSGDRVSLSLYCGETLSKPYVNKVRRIMILSFWATYCKPCRKEIPELMAFAKKHENDNVVVLCVSIDKEGAAIVDPFVKEQKYTVQVLLDPYQKTAERFGVRSLPALFVIDTMGVIRYSALGFDERSSLDKKLENIVSSIKEGRKVAPAEQIGATVPVAAESASPPAKESNISHSATSIKIGPRQKWNAVARMECGESADKVATSVGITVAELKSWNEDLKKAALGVWSTDTAAK